MGSMCSSPPEPPPNPTHVDLTHFTLLKVVGKGGFGKVNAIQRRENNELMALKRMSKAEVIKKESHIRMVWTERDIMARLHSPFLVSLIHSFQDDKECYFCMPFMQGGDLRFHLSKLGCLSEEDGRFYTAEIILGLEAMHALNIVYRDLKPDNVLLDKDGHLRVSDFGLSVELKEKNGFKIRGNAGTSGYLAPELCTGEPYGLSCDFYTLGITVYELIHGRRPFKQWKPTDTVDPLSTIRFGSGISEQCQDFIRGLLVLNPAKRLGCNPARGGWEEVKSHPWFAHVDWESIKNRAVKAPISPDPEAANCNNSADLADQLMDKEPESISLEAQKHFVGFEYNNDYKLFCETRVREANLANLNLSALPTDLGGAPHGGSTIPNSNASHMSEAEGPTITGTIGNGGGGAAGATHHVTGSATLALPVTTAGASPSNKQQQPAAAAASSSPSSAALDAASMEPAAPAPAASAFAAPASAAPSLNKQRSTGGSSGKYEVPPLSPSPVAAGGDKQQQQQPGSARGGGKAQVNTEIPFTRHAISPRKEAAAPSEAPAAAASSSPSAVAQQ